MKTITKETIDKSSTIAMQIISKELPRNNSRVCLWAKQKVSGTALAAGVLNAPLTQLPAASAVPLTRLTKSGHYFGTIPQCSKRVGLCLCLLGICMVVFSGYSAAQESDADDSMALAEPTEFELDEPFADLVVGGGGRYFCLQTVSSDRILIIDVKQKKMIGFIAGLTKDTVYCASREFLLTFDNELGTITKWRLSDQKKVTTIFSSFPGAVVCAGLGNDSNGPVLVGLSKRPLSGGLVRLLDLNTLTEMPLETQFHGYPYNGKIIPQLQASAGSEVFKLSQSKFFAGSSESIDIQRYDNDHQGRTQWMPLASGDKLISNTGIFDLQAKKLTAWMYLAVVPSVTANYVVAIPPILPARNRGTQQTSQELDSFSPICIFTGETPKQAKLPKIKFELVKKDRFNRSQVSFDNRFFLLPDQESIVTFPPARDSISIYEFDVKKVLGESKKRQPKLVTEHVRTRVNPRTRFSYVARTSPPQTGLMFELLSHPDGMKVDRHGLVTWDVPIDFKAKFAAAELSVQGPDGLDLKMKFTLAIPQQKNDNSSGLVRATLSDIQRVKPRFLNLLAKAKKGELSRKPNRTAVAPSRKPPGKRFSSTDETVVWIGELVGIDDDGKVAIQLDQGRVIGVPLNQLSVDSAIMATELNSAIQEKKTIEESYIVNNQSLLDSVCDRFSEMVTQLEELPIDEAITSVIYPDCIEDRNELEETNEKRVLDLRAKYLRLVFFPAIEAGKLDGDTINFHSRVWLKKHDGVWKIGTGIFPVPSKTKMDK